MGVRIIVCGGRDYADAARINTVLSRIHRERTIDLIIHGDAKGADRLAAKWAVERGVEAYAFPADWSLGRKAGPIRNALMLEMMPDGLVAFPGGMGTEDMQRQALKAGVTVMVISA